MRKNISLYMFILAFIFLLSSCNTSTNGIPDPDKIVPKREILIKNLENSGYSVNTLISVEGSDLTVDRIIAQKGNKSIDIVYGLSNEEASKIFELYREMYPDDYYILAQNGNYVYCVSDKKTFRKAGFQSTENVGEQYICN